MAFISSGANGLSPEQSSYLIPLKSGSSTVAVGKTRRKRKSGQIGGNRKKRTKAKAKRGRRNKGNLKRLGGQIGGKGRRKGRGKASGKRKGGRRK